jgi:hypothetical protein
MNDSLQRLMAEAARLTRSGDLQAATAAIQAALSGAPAPAQRNDGDVIDIEAREVGDAPPRPLQEPPRSAPAAPPTPGPGRFVAGRHAGPAGTRDYKLYIPPAAAQAGARLPLVVMLHGCTQDPDDFAAGTGMNEAARTRGCFVLYPAQAQGANAQRCWNWGWHAGRRAPRWNRWRPSSATRTPSSTRRWACTRACPPARRAT